LKEAIAHQRVGLDEVQATRFQLVKLFAGIERMGEKIDEALPGGYFCGTSR
jgi:hypothetical protein